MPSYDLVIRNGTVAIGGDVVAADVCIRGGRIAALEDRAGAGAREIDAAGRLVLPGGIDSHCHIEQPSWRGETAADDFYSATVSAAFGGTTTVIPFAIQQKGRAMRPAVEAYRAVASPKAVVDYAFHLIIVDPTADLLGQELPALIRDGYTSVKCYMTYEGFKLGDRQLLDLLSVTRREGAMTMVHAENDDMLGWMTERLYAAGLTQAMYHATAHAQLAEDEATGRAIAIGELLDVPMLFVHVSGPNATAEIRAAQTRGLKVYGETCPQYLMLTAGDLDRPGVEGAKFCCSPPPRTVDAQAAIWAGLQNGTFQVVSSDHSAYRFDASGKLPKGEKTTFGDMANGLPGLETRLPILFSEGVGRGRISLPQFVALAATNHAKLYGLYPRKGTIAIGADADIAIWDPESRVQIEASKLHDRAGYTPYEGLEVKGWPVTVLSRGRIVVDNGVLAAERGSGLFLPCALSDAAKPLGRAAPEIEHARQMAQALGRACLF